MVVGKITSATMPSASSSRRRRSASQLREPSSPSTSSPYGFSNAATHASKSSWRIDGKVRP